MRYSATALIVLLAFTASIAQAGDERAPRQMERLDRGVVAIRQGEGKVFVGWRLLGTDDECDWVQSLSRGRWRRAGEAQRGAAVESDELRRCDGGRDEGQPVLRARGRRGQGAGTDRGFTLPAGAAARPYLSIPLQDARRVYAQRRLGRRSRRRRRVRDRRAPGRAAAATTRRRARRPSRSSRRTSSTARSCGGSTSARTSARARTTRSSWSTTSTATAGPRWPARPPTAPMRRQWATVDRRRRAADHRNADGYILDGPGVPHRLRRAAPARRWPRPITSRRAATSPTGATTTATASIASWPASPISTASGRASSCAAATTRAPCWPPGTGATAS